MGKRGSIREREKILERNGFVIREIGYRIRGVSIGLWESFWSKSKKGVGGGYREVFGKYLCFLVNYNVFFFV